MAKILWDHTVHYVNNLEETIKQFTDIGLIAFRGGSHKQWGTYNALSYFDLCYIEFLGVEDRGVAERIAEPNDVVKDSIKLLPEHEIMSRVALRTDDIEKVMHHLSGYDLELSTIMDGKRLDAQGNLIEWRMLTISGDYYGLPYPFVIEWNGSDDERRKKLKETMIIQEHPCGEVSIKKGIFHVEDPVLVARQWSELFGFSVERETDEEVVLSVGSQFFVFQKGDENLMQQIVFSSNCEMEIGGNLSIGRGEYVFSGNISISTT